MLQKLKPNKAASSDCISPHLMKELAVVLSSVLIRMYQFTLNSGTITAQLKTAIVALVFKNYNCSKAANYRHVSLTSVCCKLNQHIIAKAIMNHLKENGVVSKMQHGFHQAHSCEMQLVTLIQELTGPVAHGGQWHVVVMDFAKAFNKVPYQCLPGKLHHYGIQGKRLDWVSDVLRGRS